MRVTFRETNRIIAMPGQENSWHQLQRKMFALSLCLVVLLAGCGGAASHANTNLTPPGQSVPAPTVSSISPSSGPKSGGTPVTITGTGFLSGATVSLAGSACASPVVTPTQITCTTSRAPGGKADVLVSNPGGLSGVLKDGFTYLLVLFVDGNGPNGLNKDVSQDAEAPTVVSLAGKLYVAWVENDPATSVPQVRVSAYNGNDNAPTWQRVDLGTIGINKDSTQPAGNPRLVVFQQQLYAIWAERSTVTNAYQVRVALYNGNDDSPVWTFVDYGPNGINKNAANNAHFPQLAVFNSKLYATWSEADNGTIDEIRVAVYNGIDLAPAWTFVDGNSPTVGLNKNSAKGASLSSLIDFNSNLYCVWSEVGTHAISIRFDAFNGDDSAPAWHFVDGNGADGLVKDPNAEAIAPTLAIYNSKLYATWLDDFDLSQPNQLRPTQLRAVVNDGTNSWNFVDGNGANGLNHDPTLPAYPAALMVFGNSLYAAWGEGIGIQGQGNGIAPLATQIRLAAYDANNHSPAWQFQDGDAPFFGLNKDPFRNAGEVQLAVLNSKLYLVWAEENANSKSQVRVATLQ